MILGAEVRIRDQGDDAGGNQYIDILYDICTKTKYINK